MQTDLKIVSSEMFHSEIDFLNIQYLNYLIVNFYK
jgi:hypothetical protein